METNDWEIVKNALQDYSVVPLKVKELLETNFERIQELPVYDGSSIEHTWRPSIERNIIRRDYLQFLEEQIRLNARGPDWTNLLRERREALEPYLEKELVTVRFFNCGNPSVYKIDPKSGSIIHSE